MNKNVFMTIDPEILHGTPVFKGSRVPLENLFDYLETGETMSAFLDDFPTVKREYAEKLLEYSKLATAA
ncbi:MAG: DUF433 domain-containing protein [Gammaproteobacteria bacterium]|nr:DUF433 domain-containing protein [Gammaproteobacteria bacterium]